MMKFIGLGKERVTEMGRKEGMRLMDQEVVSSEVDAAYTE